MERNINNKITSVLIVAAIVVLAALMGGAGVVAAQETTDDGSDSYVTNSTLTEQGNASAINVLVEAQGQDHDLVANGLFSTTLANGTNVTYEYVDSEGNVTATADYTVGSGLTELSINDATVSISEELADTGGSGVTSPDLNADTIANSVVAGLILLAIALVFGVRGGRQ